MGDSWRPFPRTASHRLSALKAGEQATFAAEVDDHSGAVEHDAADVEAVEVEFVLETASRYLRHTLTRADVRSVFVGIRPLVRAADVKSTAALSRDHLIHIDPTGLITVTGGKRTTWRGMAEHCVNTAAMLEHLPEKPCPTRNLNIHGFHRQPERFGPLAVYGSDALHIQDLVHAEPVLGEPLHPALTSCGAEVVWAARSEMARTVERTERLALVVAKDSVCFEQPDDELKVVRARLLEQCVRDARVLVLPHAMAVGEAEADRIRLWEKLSGRKMPQNS